MGSENPMHGHTLGEVEDHGIDQEFKNEAIKITTMKFLSDPALQARAPIFKGPRIEISNRNEAPDYRHCKQALLWRLGQVTRMRNYSSHELDLWLNLSDMYVKDPRKITDSEAALASLTIRIPSVLHRDEGM